jgi:hypothetical protein
VPSPVVARGVCHVLVAFEIGQSVDLARSEQLAATGARRPWRESRRAPQQFGNRPAPLSILQDPAGIPIVAGLEAIGVQIMLYDFGAASLSVVFPLTGPLESLPSLSGELYGHPPLLDCARTRIGALLETIAPAVVRPRLAETVEDYVIFQIDAFEPPLPPPVLVREHGATIARILRAEQGPVSDDERADALAARLSAGASDLAIVDWNASLVYDPDPSETCAVLEFANVQLLEVRFLDEQLDVALEQAYDTLTRGARGLAILRSYAADLDRIAELEADAAVVFERVTNALKLVGDQYLSRLYTLVSGRLHLGDWDASIGRKLQTIGGIYEKLADRATARRLEVLEWIVILLIAIEILLSVLPGFARH